MIILGDISGIQRYLFDVADAGGGQARRLRARSFYIQLLTEAAALRVLGAFCWPRDSEHFLLSGAGKFLLKGTADGDADGRLQSLQREFADWLLRETHGELRLALGWADGEGEIATYREAMAAIQRAKLRPWAPVAGTGWDPGRLILPPLDRPCSLCGHAAAVEEELDDETGAARLVCSRCAADRNLGKLLPRARWLLFNTTPRKADLKLLGLGAQVSDVERPDLGPGTLALADLAHPDRVPEWCPADLFHHRRLMAYIPVIDKRPVWFIDIARQARGDRLLGVLKADVDSLGLAMEGLLASGGGLQPMAAFSRELDEFFSEQLKQEIETGADPRWRSIYTVFAGGDDLLLVGPWDVMFDFAGRVRELFQQEFGARGLTLSAGLALIKPKRPIKGAVAEAERLLEQAKIVRAPLAESEKDACAAFGQLWKWDHHDRVQRAAKQLAGWVEEKQCQRGWLHTLLELAEIRQGNQELKRAPNLLATSHLAYHVERNYPRNSPMRHWGEDLVRRFDNLKDPEIRFLPAILRYALTATRAPGGEE